jgi:hypothetical protein
VLALVKAAGFVDAHFACKSGSLGELLQLGVEIAFSIGGAGRPWCIFGTSVVADKDVVFKRGQAVFLLRSDSSRLMLRASVPAFLTLKFPQPLRTHPAPSARMNA